MNKFTVKISSLDETFDAIFWRALLTSYALVVFNYEGDMVTVFPCLNKIELRDAVQLYSHLPQFIISRNQYHGSRKGLEEKLSHYI